MADDNQNAPLFSIQRLYLKDLSLEQPNSPQVLLEQGQPQVEINLGLGAETVGEATFEVTVTATVTATINDRRCSWSRPSRAASSRSATSPKRPCGRSSASTAPGIIYPYLRAIVSDVCTRAGFPPVMLSEVNFQAMYEAQQAELKAQAAGTTNGSGGARASRLTFPPRSRR
jgi:preprotein translocase subunit SecB